MYVLGKKASFIFVLSFTIVDRFTRITLLSTLEA